LADLLEAIKESDNKEIQTTNAAELAILESKFKSLLTIRPLSTLAKAHELRGDFANIFWDAKVISDIRPVWDEDVKVPPDGVVIAQTLKLKYGDVESPKELYLNMNEEDIELLISVLMRAQQKRATLESLAKESWMKILHE
jgi:mRNA-degrading endonuclease YafQ of YafQ-DinJ toxin-antitoxin module